MSTFSTNIINAVGFEHQQMIEANLPDLFERSEITNRNPVATGPSGPPK